MTNDRKYRDIYVMGDIHGDLEGYDSVFEQMFIDGMDLNHDLFVQVGDMVDGFPHSKEVVADLIELKDMFPENVIVLKGNHEELMIHGVDSPVYSDQFSVWWSQGGRETWLSYWGCDPLWSTDYVTVEGTMHEHIEWFKTLPTLAETEDYYFVHAGLAPDAVDPYTTSIFSRLWIRGPFLRSDRQWDKIVVHGHSPMKDIEVLPNRINVNTRPRQKGFVSGVRLGESFKHYKGPVTNRA